MYIHDCSVICALDLAINPISEQPPKIKVITFGAPRSGNAGFATLFNKMVPNHVRCVHKHDVVPKVPPQIMNFKHVANNVILTEPPRDAGTGRLSILYRLEHNIKQNLNRQRNKSTQSSWNDEIYSVHDCLKKRTHKIETKFNRLSRGKDFRHFIRLL